MTFVQSPLLCRRSQAVFPWPAGPAMSKAVSGHSDGPVSRITGHDWPLAPTLLWKITSSLCLKWPRIFDNRNRVQDEWKYTDIHVQKLWIYVEASKVVVTRISTQIQKPVEPKLPNAPWQNKLSLSLFLDIRYSTSVIMCLLSCKPQAELASVSSFGALGDNMQQCFFLLQSRRHHGCCLNKKHLNYWLNLCKLSTKQCQH